MRWSKSRRHEAGFTLVEVAIVLIIIGLILGAAIKGKDLIQSAKQQKFYSNFVKQWEVTVLDYYDRTGGVIGDSVANGGTTTDNSGTADGFFDSDNMLSTVVTQLQKAGLDLPTTNTSTSYEYNFKGAVSGSQKVTLALKKELIVNSAGVKVNVNALDFSTMPTDLAIAMDTMIDGHADGTAGTFRNVPDSSGTSAAWPDVNDTTVTTVEAVYILDVP